MVILISIIQLFKLITMPTRIDRAMTAIKVNVEILKKDKIPFIFAAKPKNTVTHGTNYAMEFFNRNVNEFEEAFVRDVRDMCDIAGADGDANAPVDAQDDEIMRMKAPLRLANNNEIRDYARYLIVRDRSMRIPESNNKRIKYGEESWKPSFWPDEMFCWSSSRKNFSDVKIRDFPGNISILDVLREAIKRCLERAGKDPENYFDNQGFTDEIRNKRIRNRGIYQEHIMEDNEMQEPREVVAAEEGAVFVPRRPNMYANQDNGEREEEEETEPVGNNDDIDDIGDIGDELDVDNYIRNVRENDATTQSANNEAEETESAQQTLRRSKRNITLVSYSVSSKSDLSTESEPSYAPSLASIAESTLSNSSTTLRRSKRTQKRKIVFDNSDNLLKKLKRRQKNIISESLERLIRPPSKATQQKEQEQAARERSMEERIAEEQRQHEERMSILEKEEQKREKANAKARAESKKIKEKADQLRANLSMESIKMMFKNNLKYFKNIEKGLEKSWRHTMFHSSEEKARKDRVLLENAVVQPFSNAQHDMIFNLMKQVWLSDHAMKIKNSKYVNLVLLPEVFITIYQRYFSLPTKDIAEKYMKDAGSMDPEDISPDSSLLL